MKPTRRTFEARNFPEGSGERTRLNLDGLTSEYMISYKYQVTPEAHDQPIATASNGALMFVWPCGQNYTTKREALEAIAKAEKERRDKSAPTNDKLTAYKGKVL